MNPRASRTVPFLSKVTGVPMVTLATRVMLGESLRELGYGGLPKGLWPEQPLSAVKGPVFSMAKIIGGEMALSPEMKSTGEVMGVDKTYPAALSEGADRGSYRRTGPRRRGLRLIWPIATKRRRCRFCAASYRRATRSMPLPAPPPTERAGHGGGPRSTTSGPATIRSSS